MIDQCRSGLIQTGLRVLSIDHLSTFALFLTKPFSLQQKQQTILRTTSKQINRMPTLLEKLAPELQNMILPDVLLTTFDDTPPALIAAYQGKPFQKHLLAWLKSINGTITASTRLEWKGKTLAETKRVEHLLIIW